MGGRELETDMERQRGEHEEGTFLGEMNTARIGVIRREALSGIARLELVQGRVCQEIVCKLSARSLLPRPCSVVYVINPFVSYPDSNFVIW
jgi:hypothetical protein